MESFNDDYNNKLNEQSLTKKERWLLRKERKEQVRKILKRHKKIKKALLILLPSLLLIGAIGVIAVSFTKNYASKESHPGTPKIEIPVAKYNAGTVPINGGLVKYTYEIKNTGVGDLEIDKIWTSCMCTTAKLKVGGEESAEFGMHDNPIFWSQKIAPGETGELEITFDPAFHGPQGTGQLVRIIYISTNDPENKKIELKLLVNVE